MAGTGWQVELDAGWLWLRVLYMTVPIRGVYVVRPPVDAWNRRQYQTLYVLVFLPTPNRWVTYVDVPKGQTGARQRESETSPCYSEGMQFKRYKLFISEISHLTFSGCSWPEVAETLGNREPWSEWSYFYFILRTNKKSLNYSLGKHKIKLQGDPTLEPPGCYKSKRQQQIMVKR